MSLSSREHLRALRLQIANNRCTSTSNRTFLPQPILAAIFSPPAIVHAVAELTCQPEDRIDLAQAIERRGRITFAILVWMQCEDAIVDFRRAGCLDSRLPLDEATARRINKDRGREFATEYQWQFLPHYFHRDDDLEIDPSVVLPFIREVGTEVGGGFGVITKVEIHPLLQDFFLRSDQPPLIVRKTLRASGSDEHRKILFTNEKRSLRLLSRLKHPNIIPFFGAYAHGKELSFLFPLIDMDLTAFFGRSTRYGDFRWNFTFFSALHGLALALNNAHNVRLHADTEGIDYAGIGYHHDLRPANILVNKKTFILADFGMGSLKPEAQGSRTNWKAGSGDYLAPECMDENFIHQDVGRAIDVWAFGCLMADVATFVQMGADGLRSFCDTRLSPGSFTNWATSYFHDSQGNVKDSVKQWLNFLISSNNLLALNKPFYSLILDILTPASRRPLIADICPRLALLSVKAHFFAVLESVTRALETNSSEVTVAAGSMKIWFERERLKAFGNVLCLYSTSWDISIPEVLEHESLKCVGILVQLFKIFQPTQVADESSECAIDDKLDISDDSSVLDQLSISGSDGYYSTSTLIASESEPAKLQISQETKTQELIQDMWDMLPKVLLKKVQSVWVNSMLETDDINQLEHLEQSLSLEKPDTYQEGAAMAMMRKIRLEMIHSPSTNSEVKKLELEFGNIVETRDSYSHKIGIYKGTLPVIIEYIYYDESWEKIPSYERSITMSLKAEGFNVNPKPQALRILQCIGFFEQLEKRRAGYGFVYQIPARESVLDSTPPPMTTLLHLLMLSAKNSRMDQHLNQPLLDDKYHLAYMLAAFLMEFHSIGWLHENFNSNNIIFFNEPPGGKSISPIHSKILTKPFILGLHKSRPGGDAWHTQGPGLETEFLDYQHPAYAITKHFRNSYDYYSLGIVLLEIGLWSPLKAWSNKPEHRTMSPDAFRGALIDTYLPRLGPRMGTAYHKVVKLLLTDGLDTKSQQKIPDPELERKAFNRFFDEVVGPLSELSEAHI